MIFAVFKVCKATGFRVWVVCPSSINKHQFAGFPRGTLIWSTKKELHSQRIESFISTFGTTNFSFFEMICQKVFRRLSWCYKHWKSCPAIGTCKWNNCYVLSVIWTDRKNCLSSFRSYYIAQSCAWDYPVSSIAKIWLGSTAWSTESILPFSEAVTRASK